METQSPYGLPNTGEHLLSRPEPVDEKLTANGAVISLSGIEILLRATGHKKEAGIVADATLKVADSLGVDAW